jgi:membrane protease subunit HflC
MRLAKIKIALSIVLILVVIFVAAGMYTVQENEFALLTRLGKVVETKNEAGLYFKTPLLESALKLPKERMLYDLPVSDVITSDKKSMVVDSFTVWRITDPLKFYQTLSSSLINAEYRIDSVVYNAVKLVISSTKQDDVISGRDGELVNSIIEKVGNTPSQQYGIKLETIETKKLDLPEDNKEAVFNRMISERNVIAAGFDSDGKAEGEKIRNGTNAEVRKLVSNAKTEAENLIAEGEAEYMRILTSAYDTKGKLDFYQFLRSIDIIGGMTGEDKTVIAGPESFLGKLFVGSDPVTPNK